MSAYLYIQDVLEETKVVDNIDFILTHIDLESGDI